MGKSDWNFVNPKGAKSNAGSMIEVRKKLKKNQRTM